MHSRNLLANSHRAAFIISTVIGSVLLVLSGGVSTAQETWDDLDRGRLLVSTFLGGTGMEGADGIPNIDMARDPEGNIIVVGLTSSTDFPATSGVIQETLAGEEDLFIAKFSSDLKTLMAATLLGGDQAEQCPRVCVDASGNIYVAGATGSAGFPGSTGGYDDELSGDWDIFVAKLDNSLTTLSASTYVGGDGTENFGFDLALDQSGSVFVAGYTDGNNFTVVPGSYDTSYNGGTSDIFVMKFDQSLTSLTASTFIGGSFRDEGTVNIAVDSEGDLLLYGTTGSDDYPRTSTAYDTSFNSPCTGEPPDLDLCVTKLSNDLTTLLASTFVGGSDFERAYRIALDSEGNVFLTGHTVSTDYPVTVGAFDEGHNGNDETFVTKLSSDLTQLLGSTYLTPNGEGGGFFIGMETDSEGNLWLAGGSPAPDYPVTDNAYDTSYNGGDLDAVLFKLSADCDTVLYGTFYGGDARDLDAAVVLGAGVDVYIAGYTTSSNLPVIGGDDSSYAGGQDAYVAKFTNSMFTRMTDGPHVSPDGTVMGASWVDYDNDGYPDLFVPVFDGPNGFYRNNGDGSFTEPAGCIVLEDNGSNAGCWADFDNDGDADGYVANGLHEPVLNYYYINDGDGTFTKVTGDISVLDAAGSIAAVCADYDDDGVLDLFVPSSVFSGASNDYLYKGLGDGSFVKVTEGPVVEDEVQSGPSCWTDIDDDGDPDLLVSKGGGATSDILYRNDSGVFTPLSGIDYLMEPNGQDFTFGDFDNDGDRDLFIPTWNGNNSALYENLGGGSFSEVTGQPILSDGHWSTASCAADFDNDGDLDIFLVNDNNSEARPDYFYVNDGTAYFSSYVDSAAVDWPGDFSCKVAPADYDRDGDIDLYVVNWYADEPNLLYRNNGNDNGWIVIRPEGILSNQSAIGCKVRVLANIGGSPVWQMREIRSHTSTRGQSPFEAHFGLGDATLVDSVVIEWPSGMLQGLSDVAVNQYVSVEEPLPGMFSRMTEGPHVTDVGRAMGVSWGDVNNDGFDDLLVSRLTEDDALYLNDGDGSFTSVTADEIVTDGGSNGCSLGDFDNDGDLDAYLTTGIHEQAVNRYYLNRGDGTFVRNTSDIVATDIGASVSATLADYDNDGRLDIYVADQGTMPPSGPCYNQFYRNLGDAEFTEITEGAAVTDPDHSNASFWADYDDDGDQDLFVLNWDVPNVLYRNDGGTFTAVTGLAILDGVNSSSLSWADYDNDGDLDLLETVYNNGGRNSLHENIGGGVYVEVTGQDIVEDPGWSNGSCWSDFDNDGDLDVYIANSSPSHPDDPDYLYLNDGSGVFTRLSGEDIVSNPGVSANLASADYDHDGDLDLFLTNGYPSLSCLLYANNGNDNNWISIRCRGVISNRSAIGTRVRLKATIGGQPVWQMREISARTGLSSQNSLNVHFGLGDALIIDSLLVEWPSGYDEVLTDVGINQFLDIVEGETIDVDGDGTIGLYDNCPEVYNPMQEDTDGNGVGDACCCGQYTMGYTGNVNCSDDGKRTLSDVSRLIDRLYISKATLCCESNANTNGSEDRKLTLSDISVLIDHLYISKAETAVCQVGSGAILEIPYGAPVTVDGVLSPGEWADATVKQYEVDGLVQVTTMIKHDGSNLLLAYYYEYTSGEHWCFPELMLDVGNDKWGGWQSDDWWFHVSSTDCEAAGAPDVYDDCSVEQPDWGGVPNFSLDPDPPPVDTFEVWISFSKIGVAVGDQVGLAFRVEWVPYTYGYWPFEVDPAVPASWSTAILELQD